MPSYHIFIGERDPFMQRTLRHILEDMYQVSFFETGQALVDAAQNTPPDLIITEALLPGMDGFRICQTLKHSPTTRHVPIIIFTWLMAEQRAMQAGADLFLLKPPNATHLITSIQGLLKQGTPP